MAAGTDLVRVEPCGVEAGRVLGGVDAIGLAGRGWLYRAGDRLLAVRRLEPPEVSVPTARIVACDEALLTPATWPPLAAAVTARFDAERLNLRSSLPGEHLEALGLRVFLHFIGKDATPAPAGGVEIVPARWPDDHDYVADLMCTSLRNGMPQVSFTGEQLAVYVHGHLRLGKPDGCDAVITLVDGARAGTAVFRHDTDELTGARMTRLVDIMTDEHGRGHGWRIAPAFEDYVARAPHLPDRVVGTVVGEPDGSERRVIDRLAGSGWTLEYTWWMPDA